MVHEGAAAEESWPIDARKFHSPGSVSGRRTTPANENSFRLRAANCRSRLLLPGLRSARTAGTIGEGAKGLASSAGLADHVLERE